MSQYNHKILSKVTAIKKFKRNFFILHVLLVRNVLFNIFYRTYNFNSTCNIKKLRIDLKNPCRGRMQPQTFDYTATQIEGMPNTVDQTVNKNSSAFCYYDGEIR
jgi:hypothetical protein